MLPNIMHANVLHNIYIYIYIYICIHTYYLYLYIYIYLCYLFPTLGVQLLDFTLNSSPCPELFSSPGTLLLARSTPHSSLECPTPKCPWSAQPQRPNPRAQPSLNCPTLCSSWTCLGISLALYQQQPLPDHLLAFPAVLGLQVFASLQSCLSLLLDGQ